MTSRLLAKRSSALRRWLVRSMLLLVEASLFEFASYILDCEFHKLHSLIHISINVLQRVDKYTRKSVDPSPLAAYGLVDELMHLLVPKNATADAESPMDVSDVGTSQTVIGLLSSLWYVE